MAQQDTFSELNPYILSPGSFAKGISQETCLANVILKQWQYGAGKKGYAMICN